LCCAFNFIASNFKNTDNLFLLDYRYLRQKEIVSIKHIGKKTLLRVDRITELKEMGVICENGVVDCQFTGRSVLSFCTTNNLPEKLEKKETLNEKLNKIISNIKKLGMVMQDDEQKELLREIYKSVNQLKK
jgi:hypothetical protein